MVDEHSPMGDVVAGLKRADDAACYEFCRRQRPALLEALAAGVTRLGEIALELECRQPQTPLGWKFPRGLQFGRGPALGPGCGL